MDRRFIGSDKIDTMLEYARFKIAVKAKLGLARACFRVVVSFLGSGLSAAFIYHGFMALGASRQLAEQALWVGFFSGLALASFIIISDIRIGEVAINIAMIPPATLLVYRSDRKDRKAGCAYDLRRIESIYLHTEYGATGLRQDAALRAISYDENGNKKTFTIIDLNPMIGPFVKGANAVELARFCATALILAKSLEGSEAAAPAPVAGIPPTRGA
jgi:hypothetical protein